MKEYLSFFQREPHWCVPACLEAVISSNRSYNLDQGEIVKSLGVGNSGFNGEIDEIRDLLKKHKFSIRQDNPFLNFCGVGDFIESGTMGSLDVIAAYDSFRLRGISSRTPLKHFSLVSDYVPSMREIVIQDPVKHKWSPVAFCIEEMARSMEISKDNRYGFYVIENM